MLHTEIHNYICNIFSTDGIFFIFYHVIYSKKLLNKIWFVTVFEVYKIYKLNDDIYYRKSQKANYPVFYFTYYIRAFKRFDSLNMYCLILFSFCYNIFSYVLVLYFYLLFFSKGLDHENSLHIFACLWVWIGWWVCKGRCKCLKHMC